MKGERSRISAAQKALRLLSREERDALEREAMEERRRMREEMTRKRQDR